ncbi:MAG: hypothetical protein JJE55_05190 [Flavobacteriaceae bacterium]|nr:hypothetical protein [Flavobacteriaceae bacterium]
MKVLEEDGIVEFIKKRNLEKPYLKAKKYMEMGFYEVVDLRKRKPKTANIFYFKINKKYRAIGYEENGSFIVAEISDHQ